MLDTLPYADRLAIHDVLAEKPTRRFDTRAKGEKRTLALMVARELNAGGDDPPLRHCPRRQRCRRNRANRRGSRGTVASGAARAC
jgi:hypothetical protein